MSEEWYPLEDWPDYEINKNFEIRSFKNRNGKGTRDDKPHPITVRTDRKGYSIVHLTRNGKGYTALLHRLMGKTFVPNPEGKPEINHENGIKSDCSIENLVWSTRKENIDHSIRTGLANVENSMAKAIEARKRKIYYYEEDRVFDSAAEAADYLNISRSLVTLCCKGEVRGAKGHHLCYLEDKSDFIEEAERKVALGYGRKRLKATNLETGEVRIYPSRRAASMDLKIPNSYISSIISGRSYKTRGWTFEDLPLDLYEER